MKPTLCHEDLPYRRCVGIVLFNTNRKVWLGKRNWDQPPEHREPEYLWQWPQGGIDDGEDPLEAAKRELYEETNVSSIRLLAEASQWYQYDLQPEMLGIALKGKYRGQTQRWFAFQFEGSDDEIDVISPGNGAHPSEFTTWQWTSLSDALEAVVPFKRDVYRQVIEAFSHLA